MSIISELSEVVDDLLEDWGSDITFTPLDKTDNYGGYSGSESEDTGNRIVTKGVPASIMNREQSNRGYGDAEEGMSRVLIKRDVSLVSGTEYKVSWAGQTWDLKDISKRGNFQNTEYNNVFQVVILRLQL